MTLLEKSRLWFNALKPATFSSFAELENNFVSNFLQCKRFEGARQEPNETNQQFLDRLNQLSLQVDRKTNVMVISTFINGLRPGNLHKNLLINSPVEVKELMDRVHTFSKTEDANRKKIDLKTRGQSKKKDFGRSKASFPHSYSKMVFHRISKSLTQVRPNEKPEFGSN